MMGVRALLLLLFLASAGGSDQTTCTRASPCFHVVPHSHMDPGWRETVSESQERAAAIFESAVQALCESAERTFVFADAAFLVSWLRESGEQTPWGLSRAVCPRLKSWREAVTHLANSGRLELVGGGWVQPDELLSPPDGVLRAFALGLEALRVQLPLCLPPTVAWQVDPFGHGAATPAVLQALNFSSVVLNRVRWRTREQARRGRSLDFRWSGAGADAGLAAHILYAHYSAPVGLDFTHALPLSEASARERGRNPALLAQLAARARASGGSHVLLLVGDDMRFANAPAALTSLDMVLRALTSSTPPVRAFYSTPRAYFDAVAAEGQPLRRRVGSFEPYTDQPLSWENTWAGAYAARPRLKAAAWRANAAAHAAGAMDALHGGDRDADAQTAQEHAAILLHHDSVTGTCAPHVAADYMRLAAETDGCSRRCAVRGAMRALGCTVSNTSSSVAVFNPLGWRANATVSVSLDVRDGLALQLTDARTGRAVPCQLEVPEQGATQTLLRFQADDLPALATRAYHANWVEPSPAAGNCGETRPEIVPLGAHLRLGELVVSRHTDGSTVQLSLAGGTGLTLRLLNYCFLPDDDAFGTGAYVTRSSLVSGLYLWAGLALGAATAQLFCFAAGHALRRRRRPANKLRSGRCALQGVACGAALVHLLTQRSSFVSDATLRSMLKNGLHAGAPLGAAAAGTFALVHGALPACVFLAGAAAGVPLWLTVAPGLHARRRPSDPGAWAPAACLRGAVRSCCSIPLAGGARLRVCSNSDAALSLHITATAETDSQTVVRVTPHGTRSHARTRDDGVRSHRWRYMRHRSVPGNAAAVATAVTLSNGYALLPMQPTAGTPLGGGVELSVARSATSDDGRGLGSGAPGRDNDASTLALRLLPAASPGALRAALRRAQHAPLAVMFAAECTQAQTAPAAAVLPRDVHVAMLRADGDGLRVTVHHVGEPGVDEAHSLASVAAAFGSSARGEDGVLVPGAIAHLSWRPAFETTPVRGDDEK